MKRAALAAAAVLWATPLMAADYILINPDGTSRVYSSPPLDIAYPPPGVPTPFVDKARGEITQGKVESSAELRARLNSPRLVIRVDPPPRTSTRAAFERTVRGAGVSELAETVESPRSRRSPP